MDDSEWKGRNAFTCSPSGNFRIWHTSGHLALNPRSKAWPVVDPRPIECDPFSPQRLCALTILAHNCTSWYRAIDPESTYSRRFFTHNEHRKNDKRHSCKHSELRDHSRMTHGVSASSLCRRRGKDAKPAHHSGRGQQRSKNRHVLPSHTQGLSKADEHHLVEFVMEGAHGTSITFQR